MGARWRRRNPEQPKRAFVDRSQPPRGGGDFFVGSRVKGDAATGAGFFSAFGFLASRVLRF
jgi:hypothetical protein